MTDRRLWRVPKNGATRRTEYTNLGCRRLGTVGGSADVDANAIVTVE